MYILAIFPFTCAHHMSALGKLCSISNGTNQLLMTQKIISVKLWCNPLGYISTTSQWTSHFAMYGFNQHAMHKYVENKPYTPQKNMFIPLLLHPAALYTSVTIDTLICLLRLGFLTPICQNATQTK